MMVITFDEEFGWSLKKKIKELNRQAELNRANQETKKSREPYSFNQIILNAQRNLYSQTRMDQREILEPQPQSEPSMPSTQRELASLQTYNESEFPIFDVICHNGDAFYYNNGNLISVDFGANNTEHSLIDAIETGMEKCGDQIQEDFEKRQRKEYLSSFNGIADMHEQYISELGKFAELRFEYCKSVNEEHNLEWAQKELLPKLESLLTHIKQTYNMNRMEVYKEIDAFLP